MYRKLILGLGDEGSVEFDNLDRSLIRFLIEDKEVLNITLSELKEIVNILDKFNTEILGGK